MLEPVVLLGRATQGLSLIRLPIQPVLGLRVLPRDCVLVVEKVPDLFPIDSDLLGKLENRTGLPKRLRRALHLKVSGTAYRWIELLIMPLVLFLGQYLIHALVGVVCESILRQLHVMALIVDLILKVHELSVVGIEPWLLICQPHMRNS